LPFTHIDNLAEISALEDEDGNDPLIDLLCQQLCEDYYSGLEKMFRGAKGNHEC